LRWPKNVINVGPGPSNTVYKDLAILMNERGDTREILKRVFFYYQCIFVLQYSTAPSTVLEFCLYC
jgi:hypothetical protein